jgi:hypothetical protein
MMIYQVEFWRGDIRVRDFTSEEHWTMDEAVQNVRDLLQAIMEDPSIEDWSGCRFEIARSDGRSVVQVPIMKAIGAIARQLGH